MFLLEIFEVELQTAGNLRVDAAGSAARNGRHLDAIPPVVVVIGASGGVVVSLVVGQQGRVSVLRMEKKKKHIQSYAKRE